MVGLVLYLGVAAAAWKKGAPWRPPFFLLCVNTIINSSTDVYKISKGLILQGARKKHRLRNLSYPFCESHKQHFVKGRKRFAVFFVGNIAPPNWT